MSFADDERMPDDAWLLSEIEAPVAPEASFRSALEQELADRLAPRDGTGPLPPGWALCPFDRFCVAELRLPARLRRNCPCLHAEPLLARLAGRVERVHARPCVGVALRERQQDRTP
ncbi:MAG TPA: hypothetical protein VFD32_01740 [Dehalococcoidia bacterium]|nr:hypothetical protein [Dehalococcoidia bacterium]